MPAKKPKVTLEQFYDRFVAFENRVDGQFQRVDSQFQHIDGQFHKVAIRFDQLEANSRLEARWDLA